MPAFGQPPFEEALDAEARGGEVVITHPTTSVALSLTSAAARSSARRLERAADDAEQTPAED